MNNFHNKKNNNNLDYNDVISYLKQTKNLKDINLITLFNEKKFKEFAKNNKTKQNQVRKIFNEVKKIERKYINDKSMEEIKKDLVFLLPKIEYSSKRKSMGQPLIDENFKTFLETSLNNVLYSNDIKNFKMFVKLLESFIGFMPKK